MYKKFEFNKIIFYLIKQVCVVRKSSWKDKKVLQCVDKRRSISLQISQNLKQIVSKAGPIESFTLLTKDS